MTYSVQVIDAARLDLLDAYSWYEEKLKGLGEEFLESFDISTQQIVANPFAFEVIYKQMRRNLFSRFPYVTIYEIHDDIIYVIAVIHTSRHPRIWKRR